MIRFAHLANRCFPYLGGALEECPHGDESNVVTIFTQIDTHEAFKYLAQISSLQAVFWGTKGRTCKMLRSERRRSGRKSRVAARHLLAEPHLEIINDCLAHNNTAETVRVWVGTFKKWPTQAVADASLVRKALRFVYQRGHSKHCSRKNYISNVWHLSVRQNLRDFCVDKKQIERHMIAMRWLIGTNSHA
jgi:hypothetical protein